MNSRDKPQWQAAGTVHAPVEQVWKILLETQPILTDSMRDEIARTKKGSVFSVSKGEHGEGRITIEVDAQANWIAVQGEWWYRGVHTVAPHKQGSLVTYSIYNIASGVGWWMAQLVQGPQQARVMHAQLAEGLAGMGKRLGCKTEMIG